MKFVRMKISWKEVEEEEEERNKTQRLYTRLKSTLTTTLARDRYTYIYTSNLYRECITGEQEMNNKSVVVNRMLRARTTPFFSKFQFLLLSRNFLRFYSC